ncbi:MAG: hydroxyacid dehydrogenase [Fibrella sp.]|nr:hydroxyacid dehydrogenase [Armatimonadota bacterium]
MNSAIVVHPDFDKTWPFAADNAHDRWREQGDVTFLRLDHADRRPAHEVLGSLGGVERLISLGVPFTTASLEALPNLRELVCTKPVGDDLIEKLAAYGVRRITHPSSGYWGQSVAEFGLALTLCGLRRIPQTHHEIITSHAAWDYSPEGGIGRPGGRGQQFGDDLRFTNGTVAGKRVRIVGAGNIASRYASFVGMLGADVAAWDPFASEPCFHRAGSRREWHLDRLMSDAEIFAPMVPLIDETRGLVTAAHIDSLPRGCLVVLVTRADICDVPALRRRVLADEIALAADVFDVEPLQLDDPLLGRHNVVHTPHNAGRTRESNESWAESLLVQFAPNHPTT